MSSSLIECQHNHHFNDQAHLIFPSVPEKCLSHPLTSPSLTLVSSYACKPFAHTDVTFGAHTQDIRQSEHSMFSRHTSCTEWASSLRIHTITISSQEDHNRPSHTRQDFCSWRSTAQPESPRYDENQTKSCSECSMDFWSKHHGASSLLHASYPLHTSPLGPPFTSLLLTATFSLPLLKPQEACLPAAPSA